MRIAISGAHDTGKTTLVQHLGRLLPGHTIVEEPYRLLEDEGHEFSAMPTLDDFELQLERSIAAVRDSSSNQIFDRCPADLLAYLLCHDDAEAFDSGNWLAQVAEAMAVLDLIVFVPIERPDRMQIPGDDYPALRRRVDRALRQMTVLDQWGFADAVIEVQGSEPQRVKLILNAIAALDRTT